MLAYMQSATSSGDGNGDGVGDGGGGGGGTKLSLAEEKQKAEAAVKRLRPSKLVQCVPEAAPHMPNANCQRKFVISTCL